MKNKKKESRKETHIMKLCAKYYTCSACPRNRECEEELNKCNDDTKMKRRV